MRDSLIKFKTFGQQSNPALIFIHGNTLDYRMWMPQIEALEKDFYCVAVDLRGFGETPPPEGKFSRHKDINDIAEFLEIKEYSLVGLSLGGDVAIDVALSFSKKVDKLILISSGIGGFVDLIIQNHL